MGPIDLAAVGTLQAVEEIAFERVRLASKGGPRLGAGRTFHRQGNGSAGGPAILVAHRECDHDLARLLEGQVQHG